MFTSFRAAVEKAVHWWVQTDDSAWVDCDLTGIDVLLTKAGIQHDQTLLDLLRKLGPVQKALQTANAGGIKDLIGCSKAFAAASSFMIAIATKGDRAVLKARGAVEQWRGELRSKVQTFLVGLMAAVVESTHSLAQIAGGFRDTRVCVTYR